MFAFGMWLLTATSSRVALYVALGATGAMVGAAYETLIAANPDLVWAPGFPYLNSIGLTADAVATVGMVLMLGAFPDGLIEHRWQRVVLSSLWVFVAVAPLTLLTTPYVVAPRYVDASAEVPNPLAVPWLEWAAPLVDLFFVHMWVGAALGLLVFLSRAFGGDEGTRTRMRVMAWTVLVWICSWLLFELTGELGIQDSILGNLAALATSHPLRR